MKMGMRQGAKNAMGNGQWAKNARNNKQVFLDNTEFPMPDAQYLS
jgi:hypothetical protein